MIASAVAPTSRNVTSTPRLDEFGFIPHLIARIRPRGIGRLYPESALRPEAYRLDDHIDQIVARQRDIGEARDARQTDDDVRDAADRARASAGAQRLER